VIDYTPFIPIYGPYKEWERMLTSHDEDDWTRVGYAVQTGAVSGAHFIFGLRHLAHVQRFGNPSGLNYLHAKSLMNKATHVMPVVLGAYALTTASVAYEQTVNKSIRSGSSGVWTGPFSSGFGSVV